MNLKEYGSDGTETKNGMKAICNSKKVGWFIYIPGKSPLTCFWALGLGAAANSNIMQEFALYATEQGLRIFTGKLLKVNLDGMDKRVFAPKGKAPPAAKIHGDALLMGIKAQMGLHIPLTALQIFFDPKVMNEVKDDEVVAPVAEARRAALTPIIQVVLTNFAARLMEANGYMTEIQALATEYDALEPSGLLGDNLLDELTALCEAKLESEKQAKSRLKEVVELTAAVKELLAEAKKLSAGKSRRLELRTRVKKIAVKVMEAEVRLNATQFEAVMLGTPLVDSEVAAVTLLIDGMKNSGKEDQLNACSDQFNAWDLALLSRSATPDDLLAHAPDVVTTDGPVNIRELFRDLGWGRLTTTYAKDAIVLKTAFNFRKIYVDQLLMSLRATWAGLIWKSVGSMSLTSDYDITLTVPGDALGAIRAVKMFNARVAADFGQQPGTIFDTNLYVRDFAPVEAKGRGKLTGVSDTPMPSKPEVLKKMLAAGQDVAALLKQRRFMDRGEFLQLMDSTSLALDQQYRKHIGADLSAEQEQKLAALLQATTLQFETADAQFEINQSKLRNLDILPPPPHSVEQIAMKKKLQEKVDGFLSPPGMREKHQEMSEIDALLNDPESEMQEEELGVLRERKRELSEELEEIPASHLFSLREVVAESKVALLAGLKKLKADGGLSDEDLVPINKEIGEIEVELLTLSASINLPDATTVTAVPTKAELLKLRALSLEMGSDLQNKEADLLREEGGDLTLELSNTLYLNSMEKAAEMEALLTTKVTELETASAERQAELTIEIDSLKSNLRDQISEGAFFASEAYQTEGAVEHVVQGMQGGGGLDVVSVWQLLQSFNENTGDFMKDMRHYDNIDDPKKVAKGFYKSSKYLHRILDTIKVIKQKFGVTDLLPFETNLLGDSEKIKKQLEDGVLAIRKGAMAFISNEGEVLSPEELEQRTDDFVLEQLDSIFRSVRLPQLSTNVLLLSKEVNGWVRARVMEAEAMASREEEAAYFRSASSRV